MALSLQGASKLSKGGVVLSLPCVPQRHAQTMHTIDAQCIHSNQNHSGCKVTSPPQEEKAVFLLQMMNHLLSRMTAPPAAPEVEGAEAL